MTDRTDDPVAAPHPPEPLPEHSTDSSPAGAPDGDDRDDDVGGMERADRANGEPNADDGGPGPGG